ncbi:MAG: ABC transporter ATP-binding protein [Opitutales bacterium]|nr:ABC transporter ATP-binding protein [Opitutales bacterium]
MSEEKTILKETFARYRRLAAENKRILIFGVLCGIIAGVSSGFGVPFFVQTVFRRIFEDADAAYSLPYLFMVASLLPAIFLIRGVAYYGNQYLLQRVCQNVLLRIRQQLFRRIQTLPVAWFERRQSGDLMAKLVGDTLQIQQAVLTVSKEGFSQPFTFLAGLGFLIFLSISQQEVGFILLLIILAPLMAVPVRIIGAKLRGRSRDLQSTLGRLTEVMAENLRGIYEVRAFNRQKAEQARFDKELRFYNRFAMKMAKYDHLTQPLMEFIAVSMVSLAFVYSYQKQIDFSTFASLGAALYFTVDAVKKIVKMVNGVQRVTGAFERIESVLQEPEQMTDPEAPLSFGTVTGHIEFKDVSFSYGGESSALKAVDLDLRPGTICAIVGHSGSGKSTLVKLLMRYYDASSGQILVDGTPIDGVRKADLRDRIAFVPQQPVLFNASVAENIALARPEASREDVIAAAKAAFADSFIQELDEGYDTVVGENAVRLSGGQRQRLALARAFLKDAPILVLDEATSALDRDSEEHIQEALTHFAKGRTVLIIAHRFSTIRLANWVVLMEAGRIEQQGKPEQLWKNELFSKLFNERG